MYDYIAKLKYYDYVAGILRHIPVNAYADSPFKIDMVPGAVVPSYMHMHIATRSLLYMIHRLGVRPE